MIQKSLTFTLLLFILFTNYTIAQSKTELFNSEVNIDKALELANKNNKTIFIDCYTTWCGPCKQMEKVIFPNDTIREFLNANFECFRLQMDETPNDSKYVQAQYKLADSINKLYRITSYPTFLFISPQGQLRHKATGYKDVVNFMKTANTALVSEKYNDPNSKYDSLINQFDKGKINYSEMPYLIDKARSFYDTVKLKLLITTFQRYLEKCDKSELYKPSTYLYLKKFLNRKSKLFSRVLNNSKERDQYTTRAIFIIDAVIQREYIFPITKTTITMRRTSSDNSEFNWVMILDTLTKHFDKEIVQRNIIGTKVIWYAYNNNIDSLATNYLHLLEMRGTDTLDHFEDFMMNYFAWSIFNNISNNKILLDICDWMADLVRRNPSKYASLETYANLLYKVGKSEEAIKCQQQSIAMIINKNIKFKDLPVYQKRLSLMKEGKPTWEPGITTF